MSKNLVISGYYIGSKIKKSNNTLYIQNKKSENIYLTKSQIKSFELIYYSDLKNIKYKSKQNYSVLITLKEEIKILLDLNNHFYNILLNELS